MLENAFFTIMSPSHRTRPPPPIPQLYLKWGNQVKIRFGPSCWLGGPIGLKPMRLNCILQDLFRLLNWFRFVKWDYWSFSAAATSVFLLVLVNCCNSTRSPDSTDLLQKTSHYYPKRSRVSWGPPIWRWYKCFQSYLLPSQCFQG